MVNAKGKCILKQLCSEVSGATGTAEAEKLNKEKFRIQSRAEQSWGIAGRESFSA